MKAAVIFAVPTNSYAHDSWRWRAVEGGADSGKSFAQYRDCFEDARERGYYVTQVVPRPVSVRCGLHAATGAENRAG